MESGSIVSLIKAHTDLELYVTKFIEYGETTKGNVRSPANEPMACIIKRKF